MNARSLLEAPVMTHRRWRDCVEASWRNLALQDIVVLTFQGYLFSRAWGAPPDPNTHLARIATSMLLTATIAMIFVTRGGWLSPGFRRSAIYRIGLFAPMLSSYFALRYCLAALEPRLLDGRLYGIDRALFGDTPSVLLDRFVTPGAVEWFAFFYYGYFFIVGAYLIGTLIFDSGQRQYELLLSSGLVVAIGHALYTVVPGIGPHSYCAAMFQRALVGGFWWDRVERAVRSGGAMLDIFPSLHTALPLLLVLHSFRHRLTAPFRQTWLALSLVVANIIVATVFLRWHYAIDLIAGGVLAVFAQRVAIGAWRFERDRAASGRQPAWERLAPIEMDVQDFQYIVALSLIHFGVVALAAVASSG